MLFYGTYSEKTALSQQPRLPTYSWAWTQSMGAKGTWGLPVWKQWACFWKGEPVKLTSRALFPHKIIVDRVTGVSWGVARSVLLGEGKRFTASFQPLRRASSLAWPAGRLRARGVRARGVRTERISGRIGGGGRVGGGGRDGKWGRRHSPTRWLWGWSCTGPPGQSRRRCWWCRGRAALRPPNSSPAPLYSKTPFWIRDFGTTNYREDKEESRGRPRRSLQCGVCVSQAQYSSPPTGNCSSALFVPFLFSRGRESESSLRLRGLPSLPSLFSSPEVWNLTILKPWTSII